MHVHTYKNINKHLWGKKYNKDSFVVYTVIADADIMPTAIFTK